MIETEDPRALRILEDWLAHDPGQHPEPAALLASPRAFRAWLGAQPARRFWRPAHPHHCPLAAFLQQEAHKPWAYVGCGEATWAPPGLDAPYGGGGLSLRLPGWAQRFLILWDLWCVLRPGGGRPRAREARAIAWLSGGRSWSS